MRDSNTKKYIISTTEWLEPVKELISNDISTKGLLMLGNYMRTHQVVVKITRNITNNYNMIKYAIKKSSNLPNFVKTFCILIRSRIIAKNSFRIGAFRCMESSINIDTKYKDTNGFCLASSDLPTNEEIMIEIMYKYTWLR